MIGVILIVDDSLTVRMDLAEAFEAAGMNPLPVASLADARRALATEDVRMVVLDVLLPDGDGVDFLRDLREGDRRALPVLLLSTEAEVHDRIRGLTTGADDYVGKPYDPLYVVVRARDLLGGSTVTDAKPTILVIDDSPTYRDRLSSILEEAGYRVLAAENGKSGLRMIADVQPNAIIVDGMMPDMDGPSLIRRVRLDAALRGLPCILLTASEEGSAQLLALEAGADAFVRKDDDTDVILARLAAVIRRAGDQPAERVASLSAPRRVLVVDDSPTYLHEVADILRAEGYDVSTASSGEDALELLAIQPVDCILMDLMMPGMGGREACIRIKAASGLRDIPLMLVSAYDDRSAMLESLGAGADDFISKSSGPEVLTARILAQIRRRQFDDENRRHQEELLAQEIAANRERSARILAEARAAMVDELERTIADRTRELEASLAERRQSERMASIGMLSASIAHEINNPLAILIGNLELIRLALNDLAGTDGADVEPAPGTLGREMLVRLGTDDDPLRDALDAAGRVRDIVRDLKIFSRSDSDTASGPVDLHKVLESVSRMASNEVRHRARLETSLGDIPPVQGSETRLGQVFLNLVVNAAQAIPAGQVAENEIRITTAPAGPDMVAIEIADTGTGIAPDTLARIFDPFFTTKPAGVGTGLGLAICQRIVTELGGAITVRSEVGKGTTFRVTLPIAEGAAPATPVATKPPAAKPRHGRILVVDDEVSLLKTIGRILARHHEVTATSSAAEAIAIIEAGQRFDVILSDLMMPEMTGWELHAKLAKLAPDQADRMLFMSGGAFTPEAAAFLAGRTAVVDKPFLPNALREAVQATLTRLGNAA
jgi:DNA-binding response OmpR family regulator/two-component sensor histidine kinase